MNTPKIFHDVEGNELDVKINHRQFLYLAISNKRYSKYAYITLSLDDAEKLIYEIQKLKKEVVNA